MSRDIIRAAVFEKTPHGPAVWLTQRSDTGLWEFPGGGEEDTDHDATATICRELFEEIGIAPTSEPRLWITNQGITRHGQPSKSQQKLYAVTEYCGDPWPDMDEVQAIQLVLVRELVNLNENTVTSLTRCFIESIVEELEKTAA